MPGDFDFQVRGLERLKGELADLGKNAARAGVEEAADYMVEMLMKESHPNYSYHSRAEAYGNSGASGDWTYQRNGETYKMQPVPGFFSAKQFHYVMAKIRSGGIEIPYTRTFNLLSGWKKTGSGLNTRIVNDAGEYVKYVMGGYTQSRHEELIPWPRINGLILKYYNDIIAAAQNGIAKLILRTLKK